MPSCEGMSESEGVVCVPVLHLPCGSVGDEAEQCSKGQSCAR